MSKSHGSPQLVWLRYVCDCPFRQGLNGRKGFKPDPDCFHGLLSVLRRLQSGKYLVENTSGFVAVFRVSDLTFDRS